MIDVRNFEIIIIFWQRLNIFIQKNIIQTNRNCLFDIFPLYGRLGTNEIIIIHIIKALQRNHRTTFFLICPNPYNIDTLIQLAFQHLDLLPQQVLLHNLAIHPIKVFHIAGDPAGVFILHAHESDVLVDEVEHGLGVRALHHPFVEEGDVPGGDRHVDGGGGEGGQVTHFLHDN